MQIYSTNMLTIGLLQAQFLLEGSDPAEEELLEMQSVGAVLEALGLSYVDDADDPRVWRMAKGRAKPQAAVQALCKLLASSHVHFLCLDHT
jgi:hypothetical protein